MIVVDLFAALLDTEPDLTAQLHEQRLLEAIGAARTEAAFAVAWLRWYFDDGGCP